MRIDSSGKVGIGETTPAAGLDVKVDTNPVLAIDRGSANNSNFNLHYNGTLTSQLSAANADFQLSAIGASTPISFYANGSERMRVLAGGGLTFNGDTAAANALDDYEEGTWTPTILFGGTNATVSAHGKYTKIGNLVHIIYQVTINNLNSGSGNILVGGLPFTPTQSPTYSHGNVQGNSNKNLPSTAGSTMPYIQNTLTTFRILYDTPTVHGDVTSDHFPVNTIFYGDGDFFTS